MGASAVDCAANATRVVGKGVGSSGYLSFSFGLAASGETL